MAQITDILIAEDNPKDFEFLESIFSAYQDHPCRLQRAQNGLIALEMALERETPLVVSDIQMPELNGIDFAKALWSRKPKARIVLWSQHKDEMYVRALARIVPA